MSVNIEKMRFDMAEQQRQSAIQQSWETRKFIVAAIVAVAASVGAGVGIGNLIWGHRQPQPIVIQLPPQPKS